MSISSQADVVVIGAGIAGLAAARHLTVAGRNVIVIEAGDDVGGRIRTDVIDGITMDRGFQLFNPSYSEGKALLDYTALDLRSFTAGVIVSIDGKHFPVADPRRDPAKAVDSLLSPIGTFREKLKFGAYAVRNALGAQTLDDVDTSASAFLRRNFGNKMTETALRPFLSGVFLEDDLATSKRFFDIVLRSFVLGTPGVPARGMQEIPRQIAAQIPNNAIVLNTRATSISSGRVDTTNGTILCRSIILATDARTANSLVPHINLPKMNDVTTWYHIADCAPAKLTNGQSTLVVDGKRFNNTLADPQRPVINSVVLTHVAPEYASDDRVLVSSSALGLHTDAAMEHQVRQHLSQLYGVSTTGWTLAGCYPVKDALPAMLPPFTPEQPVRMSDGLYVAGDHREVSSIQGALHSGRRAAEALLIDEL